MMNQSSPSKNWFGYGLLVLSVTLLLLVAGCGKDKAGEVQVDETNDGDTIEIDSAGMLIISLPSNPSTGYSWQISDPTGGLAQQGDVEHVQANAATPLVGSGGTDIFTFKAGSPGEYKLGLVYSRSFEPNVPPIETFNLTVRVK